MKNRPKRDSMFCRQAATGRRHFAGEFVPLLPPFIAHQNNKDKHKGDKPEPELDHSIELDDSRDLEQTNQSMELEETDQENMEPDIQIRLRDSEQENTMTDLTRKPLCTTQQTRRTGTKEHKARARARARNTNPNTNHQPGKKINKKSKLQPSTHRKEKPQDTKKQRTQGHYR